MQIIDSIIAKLKEKDTLFEKIYRDIFYGGSFYDKLKIVKPEEYDLDILMTLPEYASPTITISENPGFVRTQLLDFEKFSKQPEYVKYYMLVTFFGIVGYSVRCIFQRLTKTSR